MSRIILIVFFVEIMLIVAVLPPNYTARIIAYENELLFNEMGSNTGEWIVWKGSDLYQSVFINTGLSEAILGIASTSSGPENEPVQLKNATRGINAWVNERGSTAGALIQQILQRLVLLMVWVALLLVLAVPSIVDGVIQRRVRQASFHHVSTMARSYATRTYSVISVIFTLGLFAPIPFHPFLVPVVFLVILAAVNVTIANTQKEL